MLIRDVKNNRKRPKIDPVLMDGDPRYEQEEKKEVQKLPVVVI